MNPFQIPKCALGFHHRDAKRAVRDEAGRFTSVCTGCGAPMWRYMDGWSVVRRDPVEVVTQTGDGPVFPTHRQTGGQTEGRTRG